MSMSTSSTTWNQEMRRVQRREYQALASAFRIVGLWQDLFFFRILAIVEDAETFIYWRQFDCSTSSYHTGTVSGEL